MSSSRNRPFRLALGLVVLAVAPWVLFRAVPALIPYGGQKALDSVRFSLVVEDKNGDELQVLPLASGLRRVYQPLGQLPAALVRTVLADEDQRFWWHPGVDPLALVRALFQNASAGETVSGASTISMQVARLLRPHQRSAAGKLLEAWDALQLESRLGKGGVLELYLNLIPFGQNVEGFPAAARAFFGRAVQDLSPVEFSALALVPRSPQTYNPYLLPGNPTALDPQRQRIWPFRAPHFVRWLAGLPEMAQLDGRKPVHTAIEPDLQNALEELVAHTVDAARRKRVSNAAAFFVRPDTMEVAAWVGSADFTSESDKGQIDGVIMQRQPGSTLKPFLYSLALESGFTASTILPDIPTDFGGAEVYTPANFNDQFNGPVRLRQALASSLNVPAVATLQRIGVLPLTDFLVKAGFRSLEPQRDHLGLGLALGNAEVSLFELVQAYGLFVHDGKFRPLLASDPTGPPLGASAPPLVDPRVAGLIRDILTRHPDRTLAFGHGGNTRLSFEGALKTGTSNQFNNIWAIGFTTDLLGGVWMGNFGGQTVVGTADSGYPASILSKTLEAFSAHRAFPPLQGLERHRICAVSGMSATDDCPHTLDEWFLPGTVPPPCDWHQAGGVVRYPQEFHSWLTKYRYRQNGGFLDGPVQILRPVDGAVFFLDPTLPAAGQQLALEATGAGKAEVSVDDRVVLRAPFPLRVWVNLTPGPHRLTVRSDAGDEAAASYEVR